MDLFMLGMVVLALAASPFVLLVLHLVARDRIKKLEGRVREVTEDYEARLRRLEGRLGGLGQRADPAAEPPSAESAVERDEAPAATGVAAAGPQPAYVSSTSTPQDAAGGSAIVSSDPAAPAPTVSPQPPRAPRRTRTSADWEEIIGGNWLNKIGALVIVIGIALALGYSMRYLGPAGRVGLALAASAAMLAAGGLLESNDRYRVFARGLIGGGWAALYFTTFAMHGLEAARIIESPVVGTLLLLAVAAGMVLHSLLYRSASVTGLAYFVTFATLAIVPLSRFALFASLPAAASLLYIGRRFRWTQMMVAGVVFTYGMYLVRGGSPDVGPEDWVFGQLLLFVYWLLFEAFDLAELRRRVAGGLDETLMPLNAAGFVGASLLGWTAVRPDTLWALFVLTAAMLTASAVLRGMITGTLIGDPSGERTGRLRGDGHEIALLAAAVMLALAIGRGFDGWRESVAWLLEAQLLVLGGLALRSPFLRHVGSGVMALAVLAVTFDRLPSSRVVAALGHVWQQSTPIALLAAAALYGNRALLRRAAGVRVGGLEHVYNWAGTFFVAAALANELPDPWIAPAWFALGLALAGASMSRGAGELYLQGYVTIVFAWLLMMLGNVPASDIVWGMPARWATALPMAAVLYALAYSRRLPADPAGALHGDAHAIGSGDAASGEHPGGKPRRVDALADSLDRGAAATAFAAATLLLWWFLGFEVSGRWLTVAWGLQGAALLTAGFGLRVRRVRLTGLALLGVCVTKLFVYDAAELEIVFRIFSFIILGALLLAVSFAYSRYRDQIRRLL